MKKKFLPIYLFIMMMSLVLTTNEATAQNWGVSLGGGFIRGDYYSSGSLNFGLAFSNFTLDFATNMAQGEGEELDYQSDQSVLVTDKSRLGNLMIGYSFPVWNEKLFVNPKVGIHYEAAIVNDYTPPTTHYFGDNEYKFDFGVDASYFIIDYIYVKAGASMYQPFSLSVGLGGATFD